LEIDVSRIGSEFDDSMQGSNEGGGVRTDKEEFEELIDSWVDV
jgi:hypothetical protein